MDGAAEGKARMGCGLCNDSDSGILLSVPTKEMEQDERRRRVENAD